MTAAAYKLSTLNPLLDLLGCDIAIGSANTEGYLPDPMPQEAACLSTRAVDRRRREFAAGRFAARQAMGELGYHTVPVLAGDDRAPIWPTGLVGSISHTHSCAVAAVGKECDGISAIGIDIETSTPLDSALYESLFSARERSWLRSQVDDALLAKVCFSAKEAAYKCQYPLSGKLFGFDGIDLELDIASRTFQAVFNHEQPPFEQGAVIPGRFHIGPDYIVTATELRGARAQ